MGMSGFIYYSQQLPDAVKRYSISELELTGILAKYLHLNIS